MNKIEAALMAALLKVEQDIGTCQSYHGGSLFSNLQKDFASFKTILLELLSDNNNEE